MADNINNEPVNIYNVHADKTKNLVINDEAFQKPLVVEKKISLTKKS